MVATSVFSERLFNYSSAGYAIGDKQSKFIIKSLRMLTHFETSKIECHTLYVMTYYYTICDTEFRQL